MIERIEQLFAEHGDTAYDGARRESVSALAHALQCAQLAEWAQAEPAQVAAALLHDLGHFVEPAPDDTLDDDHEQRAARVLAPAFAPAVIEPIRLHVLAKRYLVATDRRYLDTLSPASLHSLRLQGGALDAQQCLLFEAMPFAQQAVALRRWDDAAKEAGRRTAPLAYYLPLLDELQLDAAAQRAPRAELLAIASFDT